MGHTYFRGLLLILLVSLLFADCYAYFSVEDESVTDVAGAQEVGTAYLSDAIVGEGSGDDAYSEISTFRPNRTNMALFIVVIVAISAIVEAKSGFVRKKVRKNR